jgi:hypothetical protein
MNGRVEKGRSPAQRSQFFPKDGIGKTVFTASPLLMAKL